MSKFSKALEKIQEERVENTEPVKKSGNFKAPPSEMAAAEPRSQWERGIATVKNTTPDNRIVMLRFPNSMIAEQYRMLRTSLKAQLAARNAQVIMISSSINSEGKTITAANLALSLAEDGDCKVALIDADLRRGKIAEYLGFGKRQGLSELLRDGLAPKHVMVRNSIPNLLVMPRGEVPKKPAELVNSNHFHVMIAELRSHFDYIVIDAPPIMSVADAAILAKESDGILFVMQAGRTPKSVIAHAHQLFKQANAKIFGYVLTNVEYQSADYRYYSYNYDEDLEDPETGDFRKRFKYEIRKAGRVLKDAEENFNKWWDQTVVKKSKRRLRHESEV